MYNIIMWNIVNFYVIFNLEIDKLYEIFENSFYTPIIKGLLQ